MKEEILGKPSFAILQKGEFYAHNLGRTDKHRITKFQTGATRGKQEKRADDTKVCCLFNVRVTAMHFLQDCLGLG